MSECEWIDIFGDNLRDIIADSRMTQEEVAEEAGISQSAISRYINKQMMPSLKTVINLAYVLDCDITDFIDFGEMIE